MDRHSSPHSPVSSGSHSSASWLQRLALTGERGGTSRMPNEIKADVNLRCHSTISERLHSPIESQFSFQGPSRMPFGEPVHAFSKNIHHQNSEIERVRSEYLSLHNIPVPEMHASMLTSHDFNNWLYSDAQLLRFVEHMFLDLGLPTSCSFSSDVLETWLLSVYRCYNLVPFHNFKHAFMVTQMMYSLIKRSRMDRCLSPLDLLVLMFSALSHDLDHPGFTNSYQINVGSWLALRYNDCSPLENHHCAVAFELIRQSSSNITCGLQPAERKWFRKAVIRSILATDMSRHAEQMNEFKQALPRMSTSTRDQFGRVLESDPDLRLIIMPMLLKACDLSNEIRPVDVAELWLDCLQDEFFYQANAEKLAGLPVAPFMDPEKFVRASTQLVFLRNILVPLFEAISSVFPELKVLQTCAEERIAYYLSLEKQPDEKKSPPLAPDLCTLHLSRSTDNLHVKSKEDKSKRSTKMVQVSSTSSPHRMNHSDSTIQSDSKPIRNRNNILYKLDQDPSLVSSSTNSLVTANI